MTKKKKNTEEAMPKMAKRPRSKMPKKKNISAEEANELSIKDAEFTLEKVSEETETENKIDSAIDNSPQTTTPETPIDETISQEEVEVSLETNEDAVEPEEIVQEESINQDTNKNLKKFNIDLTADIDGSRKRQENQNTMRKMMGYDHMGMCYD